MAKRGRPRKSITLDKPKGPKFKQVDRFCFAEDGIFSGDGLFRWWREYGDSGYDWTGQFDIIDKEKLKGLISMARTLGITVLFKDTCMEGLEHELYMSIEESGIEGIL